MDFGDQIQKGHRPTAALERSGLKVEGIPTNPVGPFVHFVAVVGRAHPVANESGIGLQTQNIVPTPIEILRIARPIVPLIISRENVRYEWHTHDGSFKPCNLHRLVPFIE